MADSLLTAGSTIQCSHGGTATITPSQSRVRAAGELVATIMDTTTVSGCSFQIPIVVGTKPQPCITVQWATAAGRVRIAGQPVLLQTSSGICQSAEQIPQGAPTVTQVQSRVRGV